MEFGEQKAWPLTQSFFRMHVSEGQRVYLYHHGIVYFGYDICFIIKKKNNPYLCNPQSHLSSPASELGCVRAPSLP